MGPYDNMTGYYVESPALMNSVWLEDDDGFLYIIGDENSEIEGPDGHILDSLNALLRETGKLTPADLESLDLILVDDGLKRWNPVDGFYHA